MKPIALIILVALAVGFYLNKTQPQSDAQVLIEDTVDSSLAAPVRPDVPL
jgi:hypothetical protein